MDNKIVAELKARDRGLLELIELQERQIDNLAAQLGMAYVVQVATLRALEEVNRMLESHQSQLLDSANLTLRVDHIEDGTIQDIMRRLTCVEERTACKEKRNESSAGV